MSAAEARLPSIDFGHQAQRVQRRALEAFHSRYCGSAPGRHFPRFDDRLLGGRLHARRPHMPASLSRRPRRRTALKAHAPSHAPLSRLRSRGSPARASYLMPQETLLRVVLEFSAPMRPSLPIDRVALATASIRSHEHVMIGDMPRDDAAMSQLRAPAGLICRGFNICSVAPAHYFSKRGL